jgi:hypothetical protein
MKYRYSAFNAQGSRLIIVVVQLGAVKIYVAAVEALRKRARRITLMYLTFVLLEAFFEPSQLGGGSLFFNERRKELVLSLVL